MELSPREPRPHYDKIGFPAIKKEDLTINYLIDEEVEQERLARWEKLLPRIN